MVKGVPFKWGMCLVSFLQGRSFQISNPDSDARYSICGTRWTTTTQKTLKKSVSVHCYLCLMCQVDRRQSKDSHTCVWLSGRSQYWQLWAVFIHTVVLICAMAAIVCTRFWPSYTAQYLASPLVDELVSAEVTLQCDVDVEELKQKISIHLARAINALDIHHDDVEVFSRQVIDFWKGTS